jgi:hypothetical protein
MPEETKTYTRTASISISELVPDKGQLPYCEAWMRDGNNCNHKAKYTQDGHPVCGIHVGKPLTIWSRWK